MQNIVVEDAGHYSFADAALLTPRALARLTSMNGGIDPQRALELTRTYVSTFFDVHLMIGRRIY